MPKLVKLEISNFMGIAQRVIEPGAVNLVRGGNGRGKTSLTEAVRFLLEGGTDASLLSDGAEKGGVRGTWDNGIVATRGISAKGQTIDLKIPVDGQTVSLSGIKEARGFLSNLVGEIAVDPMALSYCPETKLAEYVSDLCSPEVTDGELREAAGISIPKTLKGTGLDRLAAVRKLVYDERTGVNRVASDKATTAEQLRATLPPESEEGADLAALRARKEGLERRVNASYGTADVAYEEGKKAARKGAEERIKGFDEMLERSIERQRAETKAAADAVLAEERLVIETLTADREGAKREATREVAPEIEALTAEIARAESLVEEHARASKTREIIAASEREARDGKAKSKELTAALERIDALRDRKLSSLPIKGLEIRDGEVFYQDRPWRRVNTAQQMEVGFEIALVKAGKSGLVIVDHFEALEPEAQEQLIGLALARGLQVFGAERTQGPLLVESKVEADGKAAA